MLIEDATVELLTTRKARVSWTGTAALVAWAFVNGLLKEGPVSFDGTDRYLDLDISDPFRIEIHECAEGEAPEALSPRLPQRPILAWSPRANATKYYAYRKAYLAAAEAILGIVAHDESGHFEFQGSADLRQDGGIWNWFRIEALSARGKETVRAAWPHLVRGLPAKPASCAIAGAAGMFTLTLGL
jgi:hypothetical protein